VAGLFELELALKMRFEKIIFSGPGKSEEELKLALRNKSRVIISVDNLDELERLRGLVKSATGKVKICFRVNPSDEISEAWSKFGLNLGELKIAIDRIRQESHFIWVGLHFHSSWNSTPERYVKNIELIGRFLKNTFKQSEMSNLEFLDIGGGFFPEAEGTLFKASSKGKLMTLLDSEGIPHKKNLDITDYSVEDPLEISVFAKEISKAINKHIRSLKKNIGIYCEPGRFITKHSTKIITEVLSLKKDGCIVDSGTHTMLGENSLEEYEYAPVINLSNPSLKLNKFKIYGSLCAPYDMWGFRYYGTKIERGDILIILNQGAYTFSFAQRFIKPVAPYIVLTKNNKLIRIKERERFKDRYRGCKMYT